ncbi:ribonuclease H [Senna tora]|uniref:Ribonuclease H n=1 Tax=Senna tora TaxID=362788 RepID=A0A835C5Q0_9FABA|nr:ribonuclease H [Senna tora]
MKQEVAKEFEPLKFSKRKIHLQRGSDLCKHKYEGGLGIRNVQALNQARLAKQLWKVIVPHSVHQGLDSKGIMKGKDIILNYLQWQHNTAPWKKQMLIEVYDTPVAKQISPISVSVTSIKDRILKNQQSLQVDDWIRGRMNNQEIWNSGGFKFICVALQCSIYGLAYDNSRKLFYENLYSQGSKNCESIVSLPDNGMLIVEE